MRHPLLSSAAVLLCAAATAHASTITDLITFSATGEINASGSYTLSFDPSLIYTNETAAFQVNSFNDSLPTPAVTGFNYNHFLTIQGVLPGPNGYTSDPSSYFLSLYLIPTPSFLIFAAPDPLHHGSFYLDFSGTVTVTSLSTTVTPEPSGLLLLGTGLFGAVALLRSRALPCT